MTNRLKIWMIAIGLLGLLAAPAAAQPAYSDSQDFSLNSQLFEWSPSFFDSLDFLLNTQLAGASLSSSDSNSFNVNFTHVNRAWADSEDVILDIAPTGPWLNVAPAAGLSFGSVPVNGSANLVLVVTNGGGGTLSGSASVSAPFSIVSGGTYNLGPGVQQNVTVRYSPTSAGSYVRNVTFSATGMSVTRQVNGTAGAAAPTFGAIAGQVTGSSSSAQNNQAASPNETGTPLRGVLVQAFESGTSKPVGQAVFSQDIGSYYLNSLPPGAYDLLTVTFPVYKLFEGIKVQNVSVTADNTTIQDLFCPASQSSTGLPVPVVLIRGYLPRQCWDEDKDVPSGANEFVYWETLRDRLPPGFEAWDCNEPQSGAPIIFICGAPGSANIIDGSKSIDSNSKSLRDYLDRKLDEYEVVHNQLPAKIYFVCHSMGGLIVRRFLSDNKDIQSITTKVVMLGTPNGGTRLADFAWHNPLVLFWPPGAAFWGATKDLRPISVKSNIPKDFPPDIELYLLAGTYPSTISYDISGGLLPLLSPEDDAINDGIVSRKSVQGFCAFRVPADPTGMIAAGFHDILEPWFFPQPKEDCTTLQNHTQLHEENTSISDWIVNRLQDGNHPNGTSYGLTCEQPSSANLAIALEAEPEPEPSCQIEGASLMAQGSVQTVFPVDGASTLHVRAMWATAGYNFELLDPTGTPVVPTQSISDPPAVIFDIPNPAAGNWTAAFDASAAPPEGVAFSLFVFGGCDIRLVPTTATEFAAGQDPILSCSLSAVQGEQAVPITSAVVQALVTLPDSSQAPVSLYDDGAHADGAANDGVYAAVFSGANLVGSYRVEYRADGTAAGGTFRRVEYGSFEISSAAGFIAGNLSDETVDLEGDGLADRIRLQLWATTEMEGDFSVSANLVDAAGQVRLSASEPFSRSAAGTSSISLYFDRRSIEQPGAYGPFTLENLQLLQHTPEQTNWVDTYHDAYTTQSQLIVPPAPLINAWRSVRTHSSSGELAIVLNASVSGNGSSGPTVETRNGGIRKIEIDFDGPVTLVGSGVVSVTGQTTAGGVMQGPVDYSAAATVSLLDVDTLEILFNAGDLPDETCYTIDIAGAVQSTAGIALGGDTDCNIRSLVGDTNGTGGVNLGDQLSTKSKISTPIADAPQYDVNLTGAINLGDLLTVKGRITNPAKTALCP